MRRGQERSRAARWHCVAIAMCVQGRGAGGGVGHRHKRIPMRGGGGHFQNFTTKKKKLPVLLGLSQTSAEPQLHIKQPEHETEDGGVERGMEGWRERLKWGERLILEERLAPPPPLSQKPPGGGASSLDF